MNIKKLFIVLLMLSISTAFGQRFGKFSTLTTNTPEEMKELYATAPKDRQKEGEKLVERFTEFWITDQLTEESKELFIELSNKMLDKRLRPFPHFTNFINTYIAFAESSLSEELPEWRLMIMYHINNDKNSFDKKMLSYYNLFTYNYIEDGANARWTVYGDIDDLGFEQTPVVYFKDVNLVGASKHDSLTVFNTSGKFYPSTHTWEGTEGKIDWERAGLYDVNATFKEHTIDLRFPQITVEKALLTYPELFSQPIVGTLQDKVALAVTPDKATYPRFKSDDVFLEIDDIYENVDYIGGFAVRGAQIQGAGKGLNPAQIFVKRDNKTIVKVLSQSFLFKIESVLAKDAKISIYVGEDSIYHPAADFKFTEESKHLTVSRPKIGVGRSPFYDSYHKMDIKTEAIHWKIDTETIEMKPITDHSSSSSSFFESQNYFNPDLLRQMQGYNDVNPLFSLWELFKMEGYQPLTLGRIVHHLKASQTDIKMMIIELAAQGFVEYDITNDQIHYRPKIAQYLNNDVGRKDYDNIILESSTHYAVFDLVTFDLRITGCEFFVLSDAQIVNVYPTDEKVTVKKNRDMHFSGRVIAGLFDYVAHNCDFKYDPFQVDLNVIDSMIMYVEDTRGDFNMYGEQRLRKVNSWIEEISGMLAIDMPHNKSGRIDNPKFPYFESRKPGKVFYDHKFVHNGAYTRDRFWYHVDLFTIVNLDNFVIDSLEFTGRLVSGGIFPDIPEPLQIRPDFSLGFHHQAQALPMYENRGKYDGLVDLSNKGLRGRGTIEFQTSVTYSDSLIFFLDSTNGRANTHDVSPQLASVEFPVAKTTNAMLNWVPYQDQMFIHTVDNPISIFNEGDLVGNSLITSHGMYGTGTFLFKRADLSSRLFEFKHHELLADTANLRIFSLESNDDFAFVTNNYKTHIDFKTRIGDFLANGNASEVQFVKNEFKAMAKAFEWNTIDENILRFIWDDDPYKDTDINNTDARELVDMISEGNELISTNPEQRGLHFTATAAKFDFGENIINAEGVRFIDVGDAAIVPNNGEVTILEKGVIPTFSNSRVVAGRNNKFHLVYDAVAKVYSSIDFKGSGYVDYVDEIDQVFQLKVDTMWYNKRTIGAGQIPKELDFKLSPHFGFSGRMELHSVDTFLSFFGGVSIIHDCDTNKYAAMKILQQVNPDAIFLRLHERTKDVNERKVVAAIASENRTGRIYTAFARAKDQFNDAEYINAWGYLTYDHESQEYRVASMAKLQDLTLSENIITMSKTDCITTGQGAIDMGTKLGRVDFHTNGSIVNYMKSDSAVMELITSIDFFFNDKSMKILVEAINNSAGLDFFDPSGEDAYENALQNILGYKDYIKFNNDNMMGQVKRLPQKLQVKFLFSNLSFTWDKEHSTFISQEELPMVICNSEQLYRTIPGRIVIEKRGSRNRLYIYFDIDNTSYFFQFENNTMYGFSANKAFNVEISSTKAKHRMLRSGNGLPSFYYRLGNKSQLRRFANKYIIIEEEEETDND